MLTQYTVLLEAPFEPTRRQKNSVLLAIDLTSAVADEAIKRQDSVIVAYRMKTTIKCSYVPLLTLLYRPYHFPRTQVHHFG